MSDLGIIFSLVYFDICLYLYDIAAIVIRSKDSNCPLLFFFFFSENMPRRPPPSSLILLPFTQPLPPRRKPKHTLPSIPKPTFYHPAVVSRRGPTPRQVAPRHSEDNLSSLLAQAQSMQMPHAVKDHEDLMKKGKSVRGPWDHSGSIRLRFDVESVLSPLKPVAISPL